MNTTPRHTDPVTPKPPPSDYGPPQSLAAGLGRVFEALEKRDGNGERPTPRPPACICSITVVTKLHDFEFSERSMGQWLSSVVPGLSTYAKLPPLEKGTV
jgi:hypothetical protein